MKILKLLQLAQFHGANRLADKTSRCFWIPSMLVLLGSAITLVILTINRYKESPIYMVQIEKTFEYKPFPCVILCPELSFVENKMDHFLSKLTYPGGSNITEMRRILPQLAAFFSDDMPYNLQDLVRVEQVLDYNGIDVETAGRLLTATCEETLIRCRWGRITVNCSDLFRMELSGDGFCCIFNGRSLRREMEEHGMDIKKTQPDGHWYTRQFGYSSGLMIAVNQSQKPLNIDVTYKWIALQTSRHFVDTISNGTALNPGSEQWIAYFTRNFQIAVGAKALSPSLRRCTMSFERLQYFPMYNKRYCLLENEMANTLERCQCVRMVHPKPPGATRCRAKMLRCATQATMTYNLNFQCPRTCDVDMDYIIASSFKLDPKIKPIDSFYNDLNYDRVTVVRVFIQFQKQYTKERWSYYDYLDLFSQLGGMFSVFFGCSILTLLAFLQIAWRVLTIQYQRITKALST